MQTLQHTKTLLKQGKSKSQEIKIKVSMRDDITDRSMREKRRGKWGKEIEEIQRPKIRSKLSKNITGSESPGIQSVSPLYGIQEV